jgi:Na+/melibiose symporter-like transporter
VSSPLEALRLPTAVRVGYALGSLASGAFGTVPGLLLLPYLTDSLAIPAGLAGLLVLLPKAWDVALNPIVGRLSDRTVSKRGPRRPFVLAGGLCLAVAFSAMFAHPGLGQVGGTAWVVAWFAVCATAFAFFQVPYVAMPAEMTQDPGERTRLMTLRIAVLAVAILACGAGAPEIRDAIGGPGGYRVMGLAVSALIVAGVVAAYVGTAGAPTGEVRPSAATWADVLRAVREAAAFRKLWLAFVIQAVGVGTMLAGVEYMAKVVLRRPGLSSVLFGAFVGPALLVMPLWQLAANRYGKLKCYQAASVIFGVGTASLLFAGTSLVPVLGLVVLVGAGYAGLQVFPLSLLPDVTAHEEARTQSRRAGLFAGVWTAGETLGLALGPGIYGSVLAVGGYVSGSAATAQPESAALAVRVGFSVLPAVFALAPLWLLRDKQLAQVAAKGV